MKNEISITNFQTDIGTILTSKILFYLTINYIHMKNTFLIIFWLFTCTIFSQTVTIVDSITKKHIEYANIKYLNSKDGTFSDSSGLFSLSKKLSGKVSITVLGYENKIITKKNIQSKKV
jgi:hypothetical protein